VSRGRQTNTLPPRIREQLHQYRLERGWSLRRLRREMQAPFVPGTLGKALEGLPVYDLYVVWIERWIKRTFNHAEETPSSNGPVPRTR